MVGIGRLSDIGSKLYFGTTTKHPESFPIWSRRITQDFPNQGVRLPYHEYLRLGLPANKILCKIPEAALPDFSFVGEHVSDDSALAVVEHCIRSVEQVRAEAKVAGDWDQRLAWLNDVLAELWRGRGPFPGMGSVLQFLGCQTGTAFQRTALAPMAMRGENPWEYVHGILEGTTPVPAGPHLSERAPYQQVVKDKPIFIDQDDNAVPAFDAKKQLILFLPDDEIEGYTTVNKGLLSNKATREFIDVFGVRKPSLRDEIYNKILPAYNIGGALDTTPHFRKFFRYFKDCKHDEVAAYIDLIRDKQFLRFMTPADSTVYRHVANYLYLPTPELKEWFEAKPETRFVLLDEYRDMVGPKDYERLMEFLQRLGVAATPRVVDGNSDRNIDGLEELVSGINAKRSLTIWKMLVGSWSHYVPALHVWRDRYGPRGGRKGSDYCETSANKLLRTAKWLLNSAGDLVSRDAVTIQSLSDQYDTASPGAKTFIAFLQIHDETKDTSHLSKEEVRKIRLADELEQSGLSEDEIRAAIADAKRRKAAPPQTDTGDNGDKDNDPAGSDSPIIRDIEKRRRSAKNSGAPKGLGDRQAEPSNDDEDTDDYTPKAVDFGRKLDRAKDRYASEFDRMEREQALHDKANALQRYSYGWFLALLELECIASSENNADSKTISISFGKVERDEHSSRTIVLKEPSRFIPQSIEEFSGVRVDLEFGDGRTGKLRVESFTAKEFSLLGKMASASELSDIDLNTVVGARIEVQNPSFLLQELLERFRELGYDEQFDMKAGLTADIEFVFGPPGTGKTTHLAEKVLISTMSGAAEDQGARRDRLRRGAHATPPSLKSSQPR